MEFMKKALLFALVALIILLTACSPNGNNSQVNKTVSDSTDLKPEFTIETYPKVDGSTATIPLSEAIAQNLFSMTNQEATSFVKHNKTHSAYVNLVEGKADIIFVTEPSADELQIAKDANVELEVVPVVREGFVFVVNASNPVDSLTVKQVQDIYQGKIKNWKEVGGNDIEIIPYQRNANSGSQTLMEQLVMRDLEMMDAPGYTIISGMDGLIDVVSNYDNSEGALGYSVYYYANIMYNNDSLKLLAIDGVIPNNSDISSLKYPFTSAYYAVIKKSDAKDAVSRQLLNWVLSEEGQKLAEQAGYVPVLVRY